ncbi:hypothetical protein ACIBSV_29960 [Embleya sp. NPDC050154]|uniref:hypothetical protein n=1 Tax=Embleya sp. NPDC050154 TaxID=3363988 RepID=UPI0037A5C4F5
MTKGGTDMGDHDGGNAPLKPLKPGQAPPVPSDPDKHPDGSSPPGPGRRRKDDK